MCLTALIALSTSLSACGTGAPIAPEITLLQPIIEQVFCDPDGSNCQTKSVCREFYRNVKTGEFIYVADHEIKKCHGIFGVDVKNLTSIKDYCRKVEEYILEILNPPEATKP